MFEEGARLRAERGAASVFDFTLGNPPEQPPAGVIRTLRGLAAEEPPARHGYMPNAGYPEAREAVAARLARRTGLPFDARHVLMTVGAAGAINTVLKAILDPGDEVIVPLPAFAEYEFYIGNHAGRMIPVETDEAFQLDAARVEAAITDRTKAILVNSPHNPTGVIYPAAALRELEEMLGRTGRPITVISDEPYRELVYGDSAPPELPSLVTNAAVCYSWSKSFALAGERIGYLAISPRHHQAEELAGACTFTSRVLGYVNAPAIWQRVIAGAIDAPTDVAPYREKMELFCGALERIGYQVRRPDGAFYLFPATPVPDDLAFVRRLQNEGILAVPGRGFGRAGYMRLSLTVPRETIERAIPGFERAFRAV